MDQSMQVLGTDVSMRNLSQNLRMSALDIQTRPELSKIPGLVQLVGYLREN